MAEKITVALELDGRRYTTELNRAKNATADFGATAASQVGRAGKEFTLLERGTARLGATFGRLRNVLLGAAFVGLARSSIALADEIKDLSDATGIAIDEIVKFQEALATSGKSADVALIALTGFQNKLGEARGGSDEAQQAFRKLGFSLNDLAGADNDILKQALVRMKEMPDAATRTATQMDFLGKAGRGLTINDGFINTLTDGTGATNKQSEAIARAAQLNDEFAKSFAKVRIAFLEAFNPIIKGLTWILENAPKLVTIFKVLGAILIAIAVGTGIRGIVSGIGMALRGVRALYNLSSSFFKLFTKGGDDVAKVGKKIGEVTTRVTKDRKGNVTGSVDTIKPSKSLDPLGPQNQTALGKTRDAVTAIGSVAAGAGLAYLAFTDEAEKATAAVTKQAPALVKLSEATIAAQKAVKDMGDEYANSLEQMELSLMGDQKMLSMTEEQKEAYKLQIRLMQDFEKEVENLNKKRIDGNSEVNRAVDEQIDIIQERYLIEKERLEEILLVNQKIAESINQQRKAHERVYDMTQKVKDIQDGYALDTLVGIEKELAQIEIAERKVADAAMFRVQQETMNLPQGEREKKIAEEAERINQAMAESIKIQSQAAKKGYEESRRWSTGWNKAMKEYVENATNAAKRAQDVFTTATQNMEEAIVQFAKTGKFEWRSFVSSIVEELLRQQVRELIAKTFGGMSAPASGGGGGGGGILGAIGGLLGFANGGIIPTNGPVIVGERGPELLMGARGSQVVPNNQLGGTNVVYNINAVDAASFKQMIARDPSFIYAVSQQGAKSIPSTRR